MTLRFWLLTGCVYTLFLLWMATLQGGLIILALPILVYLAAAVLFAPGEVDFQAKRTIDMDVVNQNAPVSVRLNLRYSGPHADLLLVEDDVPHLLKITQGEVAQLLAAAPGEEITLEYTLQGERGHYNLKGVRILLSEHTGLMEKPVYLSLENDFRSLPEIPRLRKVSIRPVQTHGFSGPLPAHMSGTGLDFWGVRSYQAGDVQRRINWKLSSRHERMLYTNEFEQEKFANIGLILDARQQTNISVQERSIFEYSVSAAAGLADTFLADGHRVSLLIYGFGMDRVFPGVGRLHRQRILHALTRAQIGSNYVLENLNYLPTRLFPARSQLVIISPLGSEDYPAFARMRQEGYTVLLVSPDPLAYESLAFKRRGLENSLEFTQAMQLAQIERQVLLANLLHLGVQTVSWDVELPFEQAIHASLGRQHQLFRTLRRLGL